MESSEKEYCRPNTYGLSFSSLPCQWNDTEIYNLSLLPEYASAEKVLGFTTAWQSPLRRQNEAN